MSLVNKKVVKRMADLGRLRLTAAELTGATRDLTNVLGHFASIQSINTKDVPTYNNATGLTNVTRADQAKTEELCRCAVLLKAAPAVCQNHIQVHSVFDDHAADN